MLHTETQFIRGESFTRVIFRRLHLDPPLLLALLMLIGLGLTVLYSASGQSETMMVRQSIRLGVAFVVMLVFAQVPPHQLRMWSPWLYGLGMVGLLMVFYFGDVGMGAQRWLDLGFIRFQPSEVMKLIMPMTMAWYFAGKPLPPGFWRLLWAAILAMMPMVLIAKQPDLGTAVLVGSAGFVCLFLAGMRWRLIIAGGVAVMSLMPLLWHNMHGYQQRRVLTFINPESDPLGAGYHIIQSKIAIGSGGVYGKGWLNGTQSHLDFLPERTTDFIFSVLAEEFGLFGVLLLLTIYAFILFRSIRIAIRARDTYSRIVAGSLALTFFVYVFVNVGMVSGLLPVVGVPLPLVSYGGTSMVTLMAGFGILMSIGSDRRFSPG
ncbi:MAG TPA: rod shape-determining protein RodA [Gammaproteobacteria bacterium]